VISGDTARSDNLVKLAQGADVLVHSAVYFPAVDRLIARVPNATTLRQTIIRGQTSAEDAGRVAQAAGVKTLVLSHLIPQMIRRSSIRCGLMQRGRSSRAPSSLARIFWRLSPTAASNEHFDEAEYERQLRSGVAGATIPRAAIE